MKHKHYDCIVAWAAGAEIEFLSTFTGNFERATTPDWDEDTQYRIKKEPVVQVSYFKLVTDTEFVTLTYKEFQPDIEKWDLKITYQDGKAIKAEVAE